VNGYIRSFGEPGLVLTAALLKSLENAFGQLAFDHQITKSAEEPLSASEWVEEIASSRRKEDRALVEDAASLCVAWRFLLAADLALLEQTPCLTPTRFAPG